MSNTFQSCPKCQSFILSDTFECPECGHVFDEERAQASKNTRTDEAMKSLEMYDTCRECGESVRTGLVRCWNCNAFMRSDVEAKYREMTSQPQQIIFSDIPKDKRTEFIPAREDDGLMYRPRSKVFDADEESNEFSLRDESGGGEDTDFELQTPSAPAQTPSVTPPAAKADAATTEAAQADKPAAVNAESPSETTEKPAARSAKPSATGGKSDVDDLVGIALQDQKETLRKKREKLLEARQRRVLLPCKCGAWIRVHQDQGGRVVRCRQCKASVVVPVMKKKEKDSSRKQQSGPLIKVHWLDDVRLHVIKPTDVVLKPGSLEKSFDLVDVGLHESGLHTIKLAPPAKKSLFGKSADGPPAVDEQRKQIREQIEKTGKFDAIPFGELQSIGAEQALKVRLIQPVAEAHASMFAGVPVFGEGQIAIYLPLELPDSQQAFLSFPLSVCLKISDRLKSLFGLDLGLAENGIPLKEEYDTLKCHFSELPVKSLKNVIYYQNDPAFEVALAGHICATCGIAITEESRAKKKLGGAAGKGLAKAKCPKCSNKFGDQKAWTVVRKQDAAETEEEEDVSDVLKPAGASSPQPSASKPDDSFSLKSLQGRWKMVSLGQNGDFENPRDMRSASIIFAIEGDRYSVSAGDKVQEEGTLLVDAKQDPPHLDQKISEGPDAGKSHLGIVRIIDGKLENCQAAFGDERPDSFASGSSTTASLAVFERA